MTILAIDHIQLAIPPGGEPTARSFYGHVLGLTEIPKPEPLRARGGAWFQAGPVQLHLGVEPDMRPSAKAHPAFLVADLDAILARIAAAGFRWNPSDELDNVRRGHTWDPFGNRIELIEAHGKRDR